MIGWYNEVDQWVIDIKKELLNARFAHPIIFKADIKELYEGEQKDMLLAVLQDRLETLEAKPILDEAYQQEIKLIKEILSQKENKEVGNRDRLLELYDSIFNDISLAALGIIFVLVYFFTYEFNNRRNAKNRNGGSLDYEFF